MNWLRHKRRLLGTGAGKVDIIRSSQRGTCGNGSIWVADERQTISHSGLQHLLGPAVHEIAVETIAGVITLGKNELSTSRLVHVDSPV